MNSLETEVTAVKDETAFRRDNPIVWSLTLVGPFALTGGVLFFIYELVGMNAVGRLVSTAVATFFFFGKFVILGGSEGELLEARRFYTAEQLGCSGTVHGRDDRLLSYVPSGFPVQIAGGWRETQSAG
jgi:hypothetical protein